MEYEKKNEPVRTLKKELQRVAQTLSFNQSNDTLRARMSSALSYTILESTITNFAKEIEFHDGADSFEFNVSSPSFTLADIGFRPAKGHQVLNPLERTLNLSPSMDMMVMDIRDLRPSEKTRLLASTSYHALRNGFVLGIVTAIGFQMGNKLFQNGGIETMQQGLSTIAAVALGAAAVTISGKQLFRTVPKIKNAFEANTLGIAIKGKDPDEKLTYNTLGDRLDQARLFVYR